MKKYPDEVIRKLEEVYGYYASRNNWGYLVDLDNKIRDPADAWIVTNVDILHREWVKVLLKKGVIGAAISAISAVGAVLVYREAEKKKKK